MVKGYRLYIGSCISICITLADLGADVIKIENPSQADMRVVGSEPVGANKEYDTPYKGENGKF